MKKINQISTNIGTDVMQLPIPDSDKVLGSLPLAAKREFIFHDVVTDCVNPLTGTPIATQNDTPIKKYRAFRKIAKEIDYDADVSIEACCVYRSIFPFAKGEITRQNKYNRYGLKYEMTSAEHGWSLRGDTMNSAATSLKAYCDLMGNDAELPKDALMFIDIYHALGNFLLIPYKEVFGLNGARGCGTSKDYIDLFLLAVYNFYRELDGKELHGTWTLKDIYGTERLVNFFEEYLCTFIEGGKPSWSAYIESNFLADYVTSNADGTYGVPVELWQGHFEAKSGDEAVSPCTKEQFEEFWSKAQHLILMRNYSIYNEIFKIRKSRFF